MAETDESSIKANQLLTVQDVARWLQVSRTTVYALRKAGELPPPIRVGRGVRWRLRDIEAWIASRRIAYCDRGQS